MWAHEYAAHRDSGLEAMSELHVLGRVSLHLLRVLVQHSEAARDLLLAHADRHATPGMHMHAAIQHSAAMLCDEAHGDEVGVAVERYMNAILAQAAHVRSRLQSYVKAIVKPRLQSYCHATSKGAAGTGCQLCH